MFWTQKAQQTQEQDWCISKAEYHVYWSSTFMVGQTEMARCPLQNCGILQSDGWDEAHVVTGRTSQSGASGPIYVQNQGILTMTSWQVVVRSKNWIDWFKNDCWRRAHEIQTMECGWNWQTAPMALTCMDALVNMWRQPPLNKPPLHLLYRRPGLAWRNHVESHRGDVLLRSMAPLATFRLPCQVQQLTSSIGMWGPIANPTIGGISLLLPGWVQYTYSVVKVDNWA